MLDQNAFDQSSSVTHDSHIQANFLDSQPSGRVHWNSRGISGPMVTARGGPRAESGLSSSSVQRPNHPDSLNLTQRFTQPSDQPIISVPAASYLPNLSITGARGLDEQGTDNRAFLELQRGLQRHETKTDEGASKADGKNHRFPSSHPIALMPQRNGNEQVQKRPRHVSHGTMTPISGGSTPGWTTDSSYDPANDSGLNHLDLFPGEVDGMPSRAAKPQDDDGSKGWAKLRSIFVKPPDDDQFDHNEKAMAPPSYEESGPTNFKSVPVATSSGLQLRNGPRRRPSKYEREAVRLVKQHKLSQFRSDTLSRTHHSHIPDSAEAYPDHPIMNLDTRPVTSSGVLGNLLRLYEQEKREMRGLTTVKETSSMASMSEYQGAATQGNFSDLVAQELRRYDADKSFSPSKHNLNDPRGKYPSSKSRSIAPVNGSSTTPAIGQAFAQIGSSVLTTSTKVVRGVANETGIDNALDERPKAARSDAGVFGALIATTGNLVGAVSPLHAQLGPNPKRPGFSLNRYFLPEMNAKTLKRTAQIVADASPRPFRSGFSSPTDTKTHSAPGSPKWGGDKLDRDSLSFAIPTLESGAITPTKRWPSSMMLLQNRSRTASADQSLFKRSSSHPFLPAPLARAWTDSGANTPDMSVMSDYFEQDAEKQSKLEWQKKLKRRAKEKRRKEEIFITMHVAAILQRQEFLLKLARALMMFGAPTHKIETQIQQTARVLDINCRCIYLPNLMLVAFGDDMTHTSETKFIKQTGVLDLTKLTDMHSIYWNVIHDKIGVAEASNQLDQLMRRKPLIGLFPMIFIGGFASSFICVGPQGFGGSFIDALAAFPLGMFLVYCQTIITTEVYSNVFEIVFATLNSFVAAALQSTGYFCYSAIVSGSIVLILPGFIVLSGSLELQAKNVISGSVRLVYAIIYSLFLGFGLSIGTSLWHLVRNSAAHPSRYDACQHPANKGWWRSDVPEVWALLTTPGYASALAMKNQVKVNRKEFPVMVLIACAGWACNHFSARAPALSGRQDITSALGSFCVGLLANLYGRFFDGRSFIVAVPGILYQLPSGLSNGGLLRFADSDDSFISYDTGFNVAKSLVEVALGLTVGLFASTVISYALGGRKTRNGGLFSY